jgi:acyl-CoA thioester hydrolase
MRECGEQAVGDAPRAHDRRPAFPYFHSIATRWMDNDAYGHVNNVTYYSYFDTVVNEHLIRAGGLDIARDPVVGVVVETGCTFRKSLSFADRIDSGMRVARVGATSVSYEIALFREGDDEPAASGRFVHVWVDRATQRPAPVPAKIRAALAPLVVAAAGIASPGAGSN